MQLFMRKVIRDTLTKLNGYTDVHEASDGKDAVKNTLSLHPTCPHGHHHAEYGWLEALKAIRAKDSSANVVMCSAMGQEAMVMEAVQVRGSRTLSSPFKDDRLMFIIPFWAHPDQKSKMRDEILVLVWALAAICAVLLLSYWFNTDMLRRGGRQQGG